MDFIQKYATLIKVIGVVLIVGLAVLAWDAHNANQQQIGYDRAVGVYKGQLAAKEQQARLTDEAHNKALSEAQNGRLQAEKELSRYRDSARDAEQRLRYARTEFGKRLSEASLEASRVAAETAASLLQECSGEYRQVAAAADGHLADLNQCEAAWPE